MDVVQVERMIHGATDSIVADIKRVAHHELVPEQNREALNDRDELNHLYWMCTEIYKMEDFTKQSRWLGFIQGALWALGHVYIDDLRATNKKYLT